MPGVVVVLVDDVDGVDIGAVAAGDAGAVVLVVGMASFLPQAVNATAQTTLAKASEYFMVNLPGVVSVYRDRRV